MGWGPGPAKSGQIPKHAFFVTSRPETPTKNEKRFFSIFTTRLAQCVDGLDSSLAQSPGVL